MDFDIDTLLEQLERWLRRPMSSAGTLNMVSGALIAFLGLYFVAFELLMRARFPHPGGSTGFPIFTFPSLGLLIYGIFILVSGFYARRGKAWLLSFIGSILALPVPFLGAIAAILLVKAKQEWTGFQRWLAWGILGFLGLAVVCGWAFLSMM